MQVSTRFVILSLLALSACESAPPEQVSAAPQAVRVAEVRVGPIVQGQGHLAEVVPAQTVKILAQVPGSIAQLGLGEGVALTQGSLVARISAPDVVARRARVSAERQRAEQEQAFACKQLETDKVLAASGDLAQVKLDFSEKACSSTSLAVQAAKAAEREASVAGTRSKETAPFDGQVLTYLVDPGQTVMPGMPIALYGSSEKRLKMRVVASDLEGVSEGSPVMTSSGAGQVVEIGGQAQGPGRLYEVSVYLDDSSQYRVGETITATLVVDQVAQASAVPDLALGQDETGSFVLVQEGTSIERVAVTAGPRQDGWISVEPALAPGTLVVTGALATLDTARPVLAVTP